MWYPSEWQTWVWMRTECFWFSVWILALIKLINLGFGRSNIEQNAIPLYCQRSSNRLHVVGTIYRPFLVQVSSWDVIDT